MQSCLRFSPIVICVFILCSSQSARASACGPPDEIPIFSHALDPNSIPKPPATCAELDAYSAELDIFLQNVIESYNEKLIAFGINLDEIDKNYRNALNNKVCAMAQYDPLRKAISIQQQKSKMEYFEPYKKSIYAYKRYEKLLRKKQAICLL